MATPTTTTPPVARKKHRVFLWVFLAIQALFLIWVITGAASSGGSCHGLSAADCKTAGDAGHGIAIALQVGVWCFVDFFMGVVYGIYRLARRT
jgi:hypothetical protein